jgi:hypothetical protein
MLRFFSEKQENDVDLVADAPDVVAEILRCQCEVSYGTGHWHRLKCDDDI